MTTYLSSSHVLSYKNIVTLFLFFLFALFVSWVRLDLSDSDVIYKNKFQLV